MSLVAHDVMSLLLGSMIPARRQSYNHAYPMPACTLIKEGINNAFFY